MTYKSMFYCDHANEARVAPCECPEDCGCREFMCKGHVVKPISESKPSNPKDLIGTNKVPLDLVPGTTKAYLALGHLEGHLKYGLVNWREAGVKLSIYLAALERHLEKFKGGEWEDPITKVPHLANALCCLSIIVDAYECGKLLDDRGKAAPNADLIDSFAPKVKHLRELFGDSTPTDYFLSGPKKREGPPNPNGSSDEPSTRGLQKGDN